MLGTLKQRQWYEVLNQSSPALLIIFLYIIFLPQVNAGSWTPIGNVVYDPPTTNPDCTVGHPGTFLDQGDIWRAVLFFSNEYYSNHFCEKWHENGEEPLICPDDQSWNQSTQSCVPLCLACTAKTVNSGKSCNLTPNPVNIATGNKFYRNVDYNGGGAFPLEMVRSYNSFNGSWTFSYRQSLVFLSSNQVEARRPDGQGIDFTVNGNVISADSQRTETLALLNDVYVLTLNDNLVERYDSSGRLISIEPINDQPIQLQYSTDMITVTKGSDSIVISLNSAARVIKAVLPDTTEINYSHTFTNGNYRLAKITYPDNTSAETTDNPYRTYFYEDIRYPFFITGIESENNERVSSVAYGSLGRVLSSEKGVLNSGVLRTDFEYHNDGSRTLTNSLGKQTTYHFTDINGELKMTQVEGRPSANCAAANQSYTYDANGFKDEVTDWEGNVTDYDHDARGLEVQRIEAKGTAQERVITTQWHADFRLPTKITEPNRVIDFSYDAQGLLLEREKTPVP